jgi:hypothetical protein
VIPRGRLKWPRRFRSQSVRAINPVSEFPSN